MKPANICHKNKIIFIHIPKCAGKSVEKALFNREVYRSSANHATVDTFVERHGEDIWNEYTTFAVVRNPWDRLVSWWASSSRENSRKEIMKLSFKELVDKIEKGKIKYGKSEGWLHSEKYSSVDFIIRYEKLDEEYHNLMADLGINKPLPHVNITKKKNKEADFRKYYSNPKHPNLLTRVTKILQSEIDFLGYKYED